MLPKKPSILILAPGKSLHVRKMELKEKAQGCLVPASVLLLERSDVEMQSIKKKGRWTV